MPLLYKALLKAIIYSLVLYAPLTLATNTAPRLLPISDEIVVLGQAVVIQPQAIDLEKDNLQFSLRYTPPSANINSKTGLFSWRPHAVGTYKIAIIVEETDRGEQNLQAQQTFTVTAISKNLVELGLENLDIEQLDNKLVQEIPPEAFSTFNDLDVQKLPVSVFQGISPQQFSQFTASAICGLTPAQFNQLPIDHLSYLNAQSITGFTPPIIQQFNPIHLKTLDTKAILKLPTRTISSILTNVNVEAVFSQDVEHLLPKNWSIDPETGLMSAPAGTHLTFRALNDKVVSDKVQLPYELPDLNTHFALGGESNASVLADLNQLLAENQLSHLQLTQNTEGVVSIQGQQNGVDIEYAMLPDPRRIIQKGQAEQAGFKRGQNQSLELITSQKQAFSMLPAPKDLVALEQFVGDQGKIKVEKNGEVRLRYFDEDTQTYRDSFVMFDYIVQKSNERSTRQAGIRLPQSQSRNVRAIREGRVVYNDGTEQRVYPTVLYPETLVGLLYGISGMEQVTYNTDGSFSIYLSGTDYQLLPLDGASSRQLDANQTITPSITLSGDSGLDYTVQDENVELTFTLLISLS